MLVRFIYLLLQSLTSFVLPLTLVPLVISYNSLSSFGIFSYCLVAFQIITTFVDFGISTTGIRQVSQGYTIKALIGTKLSMYVLSLPITIIFFYVQNVSFFGLFLLPLSAAFNIQFLFNYLHKEKAYSYISISIRLLGIISFLIIGNYSLVNYSILLGTLELTTTLMSYIFIKINLTPIRKHSIVKVIKYNAGFIINNLSSYSYTSYPIAYLRLFTNSLDAGTYAAIYRITSAFSNLSAPFNLILLSLKETSSFDAKKILTALSRDKNVKIFLTCVLLGVLILYLNVGSIFKLLNITNNLTNKYTYFTLASIPIIVAISRLITVNILIPLQQQNFAGIATAIPGILAAVAFSGLYKLNMIQVALVVLFSELMCSTILILGILYKTNKKNFQAKV